MADKRKLVLNLFFLIGLLSLGVMIWQIGVDVIWGNIRKIGWHFGTIIGLWGLVYLVKSFAFHVVIRDGSPESKRFSFPLTFKLTVSGYAINYITPFGLLGGEPYKILEMKPILGIQKATSSVLLYAMMHFVSHFIFWMISIPLLLLIAPNPSIPVKIVLILAAIASMVLIYWSFTVYTKGIVNKAIRFSIKLPYIGKRMRAYKLSNQEKIDQMDFLIADLYKNRKKDFFGSLTLELISRYILCLETVVLMYAINSPVTFGQSVVVESVQSFITNILFFMPMQLGSREVGFAMAFTILGLIAGQGVLVSLCFRIRELFWTILGILLIKVKPIK
ncbi:MAG: lysylphosphatidylglycerol synthase domain-containing protein [Dysgonamonadaceae bacterium]|nr:lysylphosphatidylglycerol synthase domain-containing protein [Dysgonamonadaceae bacterium]